jgi:hypothetical protein
LAKIPIKSNKVGLVGGNVVFLPLYASEDQIAEMVLGERRAMWPRLVTHLDQRGLPRRSHLVAGLRFVPKVIRFFEREEFGVSREEGSDYAPDGDEDWAP